MTPELATDLAELFARESDHAHARGDDIEGFRLECESNEWERIADRIEDEDAA